MTNRGDRLYHLGRMRRRAMSLGRLPKYANHLATCSCSMCGNPRKHYGEPTVQERRQLADLPANWDSYGAQPITPEAIAAAKWFFRHWPTASVTPCATGGVQLETEAFEFELGPDGRVVGALFTYEDGTMDEIERTNP